MENQVDQIIAKAIAEKKAVTLNYRGEPRAVIPLILCSRANRREALVCLRIMDDTIRRRVYDLRNMEGVAIAHEVPETIYDACETSKRYMECDAKRLKLKIIATRIGQ